MSEKIEVLLANQMAKVDAFDRFFTNFKKCSKANCTAGYLKGRLEGLTRMWEDFDDLNCKILSVADESSKSHPYFIKDLYSNYEEHFYNYSGKIHDLRDALKPSKASPVPESSSSSSGFHTNLALPPIQLPNFTGKYSEWQSFRDIFLVLVGNNKSLSGVQKLHYLRNAVSGEANQLLRSYHIAETNYEPAWEALTKRYENTRLLINAQLSVLLNTTAIVKESATSIRSFYDSTNESYAALKAMNIGVDHWDLAIIHIQAQRLPIETRQLWEQKLSNTTQPPTLTQYLEFLESRFRTLEAVPQLASVTKGAKHPVQSFATIQNIDCLYCKQSHSIRKCPTFQTLNFNQKQQFVRSNNLCFNCLASDHLINKCPSKRGCLHCGKRHHTQLHEVCNINNNHPSAAKRYNVPTSNAVSSSPINVPVTNVAHLQSNISSFVVNHSSHIVLLSTALIRVVQNGQTFILRALLDTGSQASFITTAAMQRLHLRALPYVTQIVGIGNASTASSNKLVRFEIRSRLHDNFAKTIEAIVLPSLTERLPPIKISFPNHKHLQNLELADPLCCQPGAIDMLLGSDVYPSIIRDGVKLGPPQSPVALNTVFGWILNGPVGLSSQCGIHIHSFFNKVDLDMQLRRFWELEEVEPISHSTNDQNLCLEHFHNTYQRESNGRFIVELPFKDTPNDLGSSFLSARSQYIQLERRLQRDPELQALYHRCLEEYLELDHMEKIPTEEIIHQPCYYLPHHGVFKESSATTKLRIVFNASCKTDKGKSLNDILHVGPTLLPDISSIIIRWRIYKVAFSADMEKMYRQVLVAKHHRDFQRILWQRPPSKTVEHYRLRTVTFGVSAAPFLAMQSIHQLVSNDGSKFPIAARALLSETYVDNVLSGEHTVENACVAQLQLINLLKQGGFHLRQWASNRPKLLHSIPESDRLLSTIHCIQEPSTITSALGLIWNHQSDELSIKFDVDTDVKEPTKRSILSQIAKLFDPLGWYAPVIIVAKIFIQKLWLQNLDWDQLLIDRDKEYWNQYAKSLIGLDKTTVPRWLYTTQTSLAELHGFCDASERAYCAVIYLKTQDQSHVRTSIIIAKTRVAPVRTVSLPRLELCGAALLARLFKRIIHIPYFNQIPINCWTDSTIVLAWLTKHPCYWKTFVANRTTVIRESVPTATWRHLPSKDNPADVATRGITSEILSSCQIWWQGPEWLRLSNENWPQQKGHTTNKETRKVAVLITTTTTTRTVALLPLDSISSYHRLIRITAYCQRFVKICKHGRSNIMTGCLIASELDEAVLYWIHQVQLESFSNDIESLQISRRVESNSKIKGLLPYIDNEGILRVGGRLEHSSLSYDEKHPIILPPKNHFTNLLIAHYHFSTLHGGVSLMIATIRRKYWIPQLRNMVKHYIHNCVKCFRLKKQMSQQLMGNLPSERVTPAPPFTTTGIDYAGPLTIRMSKGRNAKCHKGYIAIFVCFITKAIHLEAVSDLTTEALVAALRRFFARRGLSHTIYSDCGTNFVGAKAYLEKSFRKFQSQATQTAAEITANDGVHWHFIPPGSPHFGGLWEAGVKSTKFHLRRVVGNVNLTFEELTTVLTQIEACLNSRPLSSLSDNPDELSPLTPGHFLIGRALSAPSQEDLTNTSQTGLRRWNLLQKLQQDFWNRWQTEYLSSLQQRSKWMRAQPNLEVGQLVILKDERLPPMKWLLARIIAIHPGTDGLVRVVDLKTSNSILRRPIHKICQLPLYHPTNVAHKTN